jgi:hypothetical protein
MQQPASLATNLAPPFKIVIKYFVTAIFSFLVLNILLASNYNSFSGFYFQPKILALTHIATLGWITMTIFGALFQLIPVVLQVRLFSKVLAEIQFWIFSIGVVIFVYSFWFFNVAFPLTLGASLINLAVILFLINLIATLTRVKEWNITATYLSAALFYLFVTAAAGLLLAINLGYPYINGNHLIYIKYHLIIAVVGWVGMVIMGVTFKLVSMFTLTHNFSTTSGKWAFGLINAGLVGLNIELHSPNFIIFFMSAWLVAIGIFFFLYQVYIIFKDRIRRKLDAALKYTRAAFIFFGVSTLFGISFLIFNYSNVMNITLVFGYLIFFGFISMLIVGQMYKIIPFLTWYHKYSSKAGLEKVPTLKEMYNEKISYIEYYMMFASVIGVPVFLLLKLNTIVLIFFIIMLCSVIMFVFNMIKIMVI